MVRSAFVQAERGSMPYVTMCASTRCAAGCSSSPAAMTQSCGFAKLISPAVTRGRSGGSARQKR